VAVIMAGGAGTRFWPLSTRERPKQFIRLFDDQSLLQKSYHRVADLIPPSRVLVLTNAEYTGLVREQLPKIPPDTIIGEPERKDTAAAVCLGALIARARFENPTIAVLTADHLIEPVDLFQRTLLSAANQARQSGALYTFGIQPDHPATGYGYLEQGEPIADEGGIQHYQVKAFREKPDAATARRYLATERYLWNSGMFVWTANAILGEFQQHLPGYTTHLTPAAQSFGGPQWESALKEGFAALERVSIDYAVMEKAKEVRCVAGTFSWKDAGGWLAMKEHLPQDAAGNNIKGKVSALDAENNLVYCENNEETLALLGVENLVIVRFGNRTLVAHKDRLEDLKNMIHSLT
jgi:mannose-1-phosphate guanylyltransferase